MPDLLGATELYLLEKGRASLILSPDSTGVASVLYPQPVALRAAFIPDSDLETGMLRASAELESKYCLLLISLPSGDGPPNKSALLFAYQQDMNGVAWLDKTQSFHAAAMMQYRPITTQGPYWWLNELRSERTVYLLTGSSRFSCLWRVFRLEPDAFHRAVFTLSPVKLASGCPNVDFSSLTDKILEIELAAQYRDLCQSVVAHGYRDVVTKAKNIIEGVVSDRLRAISQRSGRNFGDDLQNIKKLLEDNKHRNTCGWTELEYHLMQKIRLVHAQTHATQTAKSGRALRPEFALSVVEDLIELLNVWKFAV